MSPACRISKDAISPDQRCASHDSRGAGAQVADHFAEKCWKCAGIGEVACPLGELLPIEVR